jgi:hypothetical protein
LTLGETTPLPCLGHHPRGAAVAPGQARETEKTLLRNRFRDTIPAGKGVANNVAQR